MHGNDFILNFSKNETFDLAYQIAINYYQGNFYRVVVGIQKLPHILSAIAALKLQTLRRYELNIDMYYIQ